MDPNRHLTKETLSLLSKKYDRVWLILSRDDSYGRDRNRRQIQDSLEKNYRVVLRASFVLIDALLYERIQSSKKNGSTGVSGVCSETIWNSYSLAASQI